MNRKRIMAFLVSLALLLVQTEAFAVAIRIKDEGGGSRSTSLQTDRDVFFDDFTGDTEGAAPAAYSTGGLDNGQVVIEKIDVPGGKKKNCLALVDNSNDSKNQYAGVNAVRPFGNTEGKIAFETRFKFTPKSTGHCSFTMELKSGNTIATRFVIWSADGVFSWQGTNKSGPIAHSGVFQPDTWYTVRMVADLEAQSAEVRVISDALKTSPLTSLATEKDVNNGIIICRNLDFYQSFTGKSVDTMSMSTQVYDGTYYFDYIKVERDAPSIPALNVEWVRPAPIEAPVVQAPVPHAVPDRVNVCLNGEYYYFATAPYIDDGVVMVTARNAADILGLALERAGGGYTLHNDEISISLAPGSAAAAVNGQNKEMQKPVQLMENQAFVPIRFLAELAGYQVGWENETQTVILTGNIAAKTPETEEGVE